MARSLGSLVVTLGLNAAEFTTGLTVSEAKAKAFARAVDEGIATAAKAAAVGIASMTTAAVAAYGAIDNLAKQAGSFKDLEETTGANAEALASISVSAKVAGLDMATLATTSIKLTKSLSGVDDESKSAGAAIEALGLSIKDFKALDPVAQMEALAHALAGFDDGAGKTAVLEGLVKGGAQLLPFLKELEAAGGRQVILTQRQIELADEYADKQARSAAELNLYAQVAATQALPALTAVTNAVKDFIKEIVGADSETKNLRDSDAVRSFAEGTVLAFAKVIDAGDGVIRVFQAVGLAIGAGLAARGEAMKGNFEGARAVVREFQADIDKLINRQLFSSKVEQQIASSRRNDSQRAQEDRGFKPPGKKLSFSGAIKEEKERTSEAQRYLDNLQKQVERTLELSAVEQARIDIAKGIKGLTPELERQVFAVAAQIDAYKELDRWLKESSKEFEEQVKRQRELNEEQAKATKTALDRADSAQKSNETLRDEIAIMVGGEPAREALAKGYADAAIAAAEKDKVLRASLGASQSELEALDLTIDALKEYRELLDGRSQAKQMVEDAKAINDALGSVYDDGANALIDFTNGTKTAGEAFRAFATSVLADLQRIAFAELKTQLLGDKSGSGGGLFAALAKVGASYFSGGASGGEGSGFSGGGFGEHFALGGVSRGGMAMVGENGPELVSLARGDRVFSNTQSRSMMGGQTVNNYFSVTGPVNRATENQIAIAAGRGVSRAGRR